MYIKEFDYERRVLATILSEEQMRASSFVDELNSNLLNIETQYNLRKWKYVEGDYPVFE